MTVDGKVGDPSRKWASADRPPVAHHRWVLSAADREGVHEVTPVDVPGVGNGQPEGVKVRSEHIQSAIRWLGSTYEGLVLPPLMVSGPAGAGKTRFAVAIGNEWALAPGGVSAWVNSPETFLRRLRSFAGLVVIEIGGGWASWEREKVLEGVGSRSDGLLRTVVVADRFTIAEQARAVPVELVGGSL